MEEELNEHDLEEKLYAMLHHVDETQNIVKDNKDEEQIQVDAPRSTIRRYWRTSGDAGKATAPKDTQPAIKAAPKESPLIKPATNAVPKAERRKSPIPPLADLSVFQLPPQNVKSTVEIEEHELQNPVILESSDEDEVVEVKLPPKPTITIESSDEDELQIIKSDSPTKILNKLPDRCVSASPVPSVVSSVSDEFIRGDCIALNISSRRSDNPSFDFSLHGADLLDQSTPLKKKKKKKSKEAPTSTPKSKDTFTSTPIVATQKSTTDECFATPKSKAKNKKKKSYTISEKSVPNADIYDSDSNQSIVETNKNASYVVSEKSLPSTDVYESDSSYSEVAKENTAVPISEIVSSDSNISLDKPEGSKTPETIEHSQNEIFTAVPIVDLTQNDTYISLDTSDICESLVIGNVTGFAESEDYGDENVPQNDISKFVSTKIPPILNEDLDFDNLKGKNKVCKRRRYSLTTLRADMEKFYNESWGGENFNHREIQKNMSRDKSLWAIDPKDRVPTAAKRRVTCNYCNRPGHRDDTCRMKPPVCYMCGNTGHFEPRCPRKICVNCGSPNHIYSSMCRNCCTWGNIRCNECGQNGHPASHCPDVWRRYHNTIDVNVPLEKNTQTKKHFQMYCSGCTRRGHLIHTCRSTVPFSGLPINSPYVFLYRPVYSSSPQEAHDSNEYNKIKTTKALNNTGQDSPNSPTIPRLERNKRQSKSPTVHETHVNKKRNLSITVEGEQKRNTKSPVNNNAQRKTSLSIDDNNKSKKETDKTPTADSSKIQTQNGQKAPDFIAIGSTNFDKRGHIIQDNEVSDTSDVVTSARIYVTNEIINNLKSKEGDEWLRETMAKYNVVVECTEVNLILGIKGKVGDQEAFQTALREWTTKQNEEINTNNDSNVSNQKTDGCDLSLIPKNRNNLLRQLSKALNSLKEEIGDPKDLYKELTFFQNRQQQLLKQKTISPKQVSNNRCNINIMLKKLNMVLLGQAGLADGSQHLSELYLFQKQLTNSTQKYIPPELRKEIGHHYHNIFAAIPRDDYVELLKKFYQSSTFKRKKKERSFNLNPKMNRFNKSINNVPRHQMRAHVDKQFEVGENIPNNMRQKLVFYHQRLLKTRPNGAVLKKTRVDLVRKLHSFIASTFKNEKVSSKTMKKMRKAQEQAQTFLANV